MYLGNKKLLAVYVMLALGTSSAHASKTSFSCTPITDTGNNNFTMLDNGGGIVGGTNDVSFTWDGTMFNASSDYTGPGSTSNATIASPTKFSGNKWTAHDVQVFAPGTYTFDTILGGGNSEHGIMTMTVGTGQIGMHMLFNWNGNNNIDVAVVEDKNATFGSGNDTFHEAASCLSSGVAIPGANCLWGGLAYLGGSTANRPADHQIWMLASAVNPNSVGSVPGTPMATGGPFAGFNANFNFRGTLAPSDGNCGPAIDTTPDAFSFTAVINAPLATVETSNTITVSGLGVNQSPPNPSQPATITISGSGSPQYSINGGAYTSAAGTVVNGDTVAVRATSGSADGVTITAALNIGGVTGSFVVSTPAKVGVQGSNFTMLDSNNGIVGGTNDVAASWDSACETSTASTNFSHMTLSSNTPFFSYTWTAHHIRVFCPGTYTINTACTTAQLVAGTCTPNSDPTKNYTFTVASGQIGAHMLFDWNTATNIDVVEVWNQNAVFSPSPMYTGGAACNNASQVWDLMSTDWDGDGKNGGAMIDGPFIGFSANFNVRLSTSANPLLACNTTYTPSVKVADPSNAPGCSISPTPVSALERADWWLVAGFLAWLGGIRLRYKRRQTKS